MFSIKFWYKSLSKQAQSSIHAVSFILAILSSALSILGISWNSFECIASISIVYRFLFFAVAIFLLWWGIYLFIGKKYRDKIEIPNKQMSITVTYGDIFEAPGWRVIGCDTNFRTQVDDYVISKKSLHGQLVLEHGDADEIKALVESEAKLLHLKRNENGFFDFPLGSIIRYHSSADKANYLLLAMTELNDRYESHTNMEKYEHMLMKMWKEIDRVHASNDIALPLLGNGITRFDFGPKSETSLLRCMLCTLNGSGINLDSNITIFLHSKKHNIPLYEYTDIFRIYPEK